MKEDIIPQLESIVEAIIGNFPGLCDAGHAVQVAVDLYKTIEDLVDHPQRILVSCKCGIQGGEVLIKVDVEYFFRCICIVVAAGEDRQQ